MPGEKKYSYIKYPYSKNGWICFALACVSCALTVGIFLFSIMNQGQVGNFQGACGFSAIVFAISGLWFAFLAFGEKEKNYLFALIGGAMNLCLSIAWVLVVMGGN